MSYLKAWAICIVLIFAAIYPSRGQEIQKPRTNAYDDGISLFENGLYDQSAKELEVFIQKHPHHPLVQSARFYRARARARTDSAHAGHYLQAFTQTYPNTVFTQKLLLDHANEQREAGNYQEAIDYYRQILQLSINKKQAAKVYYWMAESEAARHHYEQARQDYLTIADNYPKTDTAPKALFARGRLFLQEKKYQASSKAFQILQDRYPNDAMTRRIGTALGEAYYRQHQYQDAIQALKKGLPYLKGDAEAKAVYLIAESYNALNNFDKASSNYLRYINLTKGTDKERPAHYGLGWVYNKQKIYHWAADEFGKAAAGRDTLARKALYYQAVNEKLGGRYNQSLNTFEKFGERYKGGLWFEHAYYEWAITAYEAGKYGEAIEALLPLVRSDQTMDNPGKIYTRLGQAYFANKEYTRALQAFNAAENVTDIDPKVKREARFEKAWVQYRNQAYGPARKTFADVYRQAPKSETGKKALFWEADSYYNLDDFGQAARLFSRFIQNHPDDKLTGAARYSLGWSYFKQGQYSKATEPFRSFLKHYNPPKVALFPYDTDTRLRLGDSYYALGNYSQAIQIYQQSVQDEPGGDYALFQIGNAYYHSDRTYQAVKTFRRFLRTFPQSNLRKQAQYNIAYVYLNTQNYEQAIKEFRMAINQYPGTRWAARSQFNIGDAYYNDGQYQQAIAAYQKVLKNYPNSNYVVDAANGIEYAKQASSTGKKPAADSSSALDNYIDSNSQSNIANDKLRYQQAESLVQSGDYINAVKKLKQYIRISNNDELLPRAYVDLGKSYEHTNHNAKAVAAYKTVLADYANSTQAPSALAALGRLTYAGQNYRTSLHYYRQLSDRSGHRAEAEVGMGNAEMGMNNLSKAKQHYQAALKASGNTEAAQVGLAKIAIQQGDYEAAGQKLTPVAQSSSGETGAEAQYLLGLAKQQQGKFKEALDAYSKVKVLYKAYDHWLAEAMLHSAQSYIKLGNKGQASKELQTLIRRYPQRAEAQQAQRMLQSLK